MKWNEWSNESCVHESFNLQANGNLRIQDQYWELINEVLYANSPQGASKLPEVKDLDMCNLLRSG